MRNGFALGVRFGAAVRALREQHGWSQEQLALRAEVNRSYLGEVERGAVMPSLAVAAKLARALELSLSRLIADCEARDSRSASAGCVTVGADVRQSREAQGMRLQR
jgi:transcriptional regulator with XRE-family HTH domain